MLLEADALGCVPAISLVAALTQGRSLLPRAQGKQMQELRDDLLGGDKADSDFLVLMRAHRFAEQNNFNPQRCRPLGVNALAAREAAALADQFLRIAKDEGLGTETRDHGSEPIQRCVLAGFPDQLAQRLDAGTLRCALVHGRKGVLARESAVQHSPLLVAAEVREIEGKDAERQVLLSLATAIHDEWLRELFPEAFSDEVEVQFDPIQRRVVARRTSRFRDLVLKSKETDQVPLDRAATLLAEQVEAGECQLKQWDDAVEQWIVRANLLAQWFPEWELPPLTEADRRLLLEQICHGAISYREIKERPVWPVVKGWLSAAQQALVEQYAPERMELPNGRKFKIVYSPTAAPTIAARIQDLYGVESELRIAQNRVPLVIQVLAPNQRPIQVTQNLANFWKESYPKIKQELSRKYPKHQWR
jgi:ATP-dependent helicase HrpB